MPFVAAMWLSELLVAARDVEDVVDDLEQNTQLLREAPVGNRLRFIQAPECKYDAHARRDQAAGLKRMQAPKPVGVEVPLHHVYVLPAHHPAHADRAEQLAEGSENRRRLALLALAEQAHRLGEQAVAGEDGDVLAVDDVRR